MPDQPAESSISNIHSVPEIDEIETILRSFQGKPDEHLYQLIAQSDWKAQANAQKNISQTGDPRRLNLYRLGFAVFAVVVLVGLFLLTPTGRSLADTISRFFKLSTTQRVMETVSLTPFPTPDPGYPYNQYLLSTTEAEKLAGFPVKLPGEVPAGLHFVGSKYESEFQRVSLLFVGSKEENSGKADLYLYLSEQTGEFENFEWGLCPNGTIHQVKVNGWDAELADGVVWTTTTRPTPGVQREWVCELVDQGLAMTLRWQEEAIKYEINLAQISPMAEAPGLITEQDLIRMAESLK